MTYRSTPAFAIGGRIPPLDLHERLARSHPKLARGKVWCLTCHRFEAIDPATSLRTGWPKCCGQTMTIDAPSEREST